MAETETYVVTKLAGPKVAGRPARAGSEMALTEAQARAELLAGAIVPKGRGEADAKPFEGSKKLPGIQARAGGFDGAADAEAVAAADALPDPPAPPATRPPVTKSAPAPAAPARDA